jgi:tetratricopeptide (TPR) repeat protein
MLLSSVVFGQRNTNAEAVFKEANSLYQSENYIKAVQLYEQISVNYGVNSSELYFNLGNCYYKLNKTAPAIYNYEKALRLAPNNATYKTNITFAQKRIKNKLDEAPEIGFLDLFYSISSLMHYDNWAWLTVISSLLMLVSFAFYYFSDNSIVKRLFFSLFFVFGISILVSFFSAYSQKDTLETKKAAIVFATETAVKALPKESDQTVVVIYEGTKVLIIETLNNWQKVLLPDNKEGWVLKSAIKEIE